MAAAQRWCRAEQGKLRVELETRKRAVAELAKLRADLLRNGALRPWPLDPVQTPSSAEVTVLAQHTASTHGARLHPGAVQVHHQTMDGGGSSSPAAGWPAPCEVVKSSEV